MNPDPRERIAEGLRNLSAEISQAADPVPLRRPKRISEMTEAEAELHLEKLAAEALTGQWKAEFGEEAAK